MTGGTGGIDAMAIPIAKAKGWPVITNRNIDNKARIAGAGAEPFIDYKTEIYANAQPGGYVLDTAGGAELETNEHYEKGGKLVNLSGMPNKAFAKPSDYLSETNLVRSCGW